MGDVWLNFRLSAVKNIQRLCLAHSFSQKAEFTQTKPSISKDTKDKKYRYHKIFHLKSLLKLPKVYKKWIGPTLRIRYLLLDRAKVWMVI